MSNQSNSSDSAQQGATQRNNKKIAANPFFHYLKAQQELSQKQETAVELLLRGYSDAQAAADIGVDRGTVFRWRKSEAFAARLQHHRRLLIQQSTARLQSLLDPALDILQKQLSGDDPKHQLRAAAILVRLATPSRLAAADAPPSKKQRELLDPFTQALDNYINAPMPDGSSARTEEEDDEDGEDD